MIAYICCLSVLPRSTKEFTFSLQSNNGAGLCVVFQYNLNIKTITTSLEICQFLTSTLPYASNREGRRQARGTNQHKITRYVLTHLDWCLQLYTFRERPLPRCFGPHWILFGHGRETSEKRIKLTKRRGVGVFPPVLVIRSLPRDSTHVAEE